MVNNNPLFGVAGNPPNFWKSKFSSERALAPEWLNSIGLDALEIQCTYGVKMPEERASAFRKNSKRFNISLSIHAPYYISLGTSDPAKIENSKIEIIKSIKLAKKIGSSRVIFHPGSVEGSRNDSVERAIRLLKSVQEEFDFENVRLFPEIDGKVKKLGSFEEILSICSEVEYAWPCLDLAHLHARHNGYLTSKKDFLKVIDQVALKCGIEVLQYLHVHLYPIDWKPNVGEITHKAFFDKPSFTQLSLLESNHCFDHYLPRYEPFIELIYENGLTPTIICEAKDSQDLGSKEMKKYYKFLKNGKSDL